MPDSSMPLRAVLFDLFNTLVTGDGAQRPSRTGCRPLPGGRELLAALRQRSLKTAIISNIAHAASLDSLLQCIDPEHHFDVIVTSGEMGFGKPDERIFRTALQRLDIPAESAIHIGDDPYADVLGARKVGIQPIWFNASGRTWPNALALPVSVTSLSQVTALLIR